MKVTTVINAANINSASNQAKKAANKSAQDNTLNIDAGRRFDTFTMAGTEKTEKNAEERTKKLSAAKEELVRKLSGFTEEDKWEIAFDSYLGMQRSLLELKHTAKDQLDIFSYVQEEKAYYNHLSENGGLIEGRGKFDYEGMCDGSTVDIDEVCQKLTKLQDRINGWFKERPEKPKFYEHPENFPHLYLTSEFMCSLSEKVYAYYSAVFSAATGFSADVLNIEKGDLQFDRKGLTEENFMERATEYLDSINERSKQLADLWSEYSYNSRHSEDKITVDEQEEIRQMKESVLFKELSEYMAVIEQEF